MAQEGRPPDPALDALPSITLDPEYWGQYCTPSKTTPRSEPSRQWPGGTPNEPASLTFGRMPVQLPVLRAAEPRSWLAQPVLVAPPGLVADSPAASTDADGADLVWVTQPPSQTPGPALRAGGVSVPFRDTAELGWVVVPPF